MIDTTKLNLAWLKREAKNYSWQLLKHPLGFEKDRKFLERAGADIVDGDFVRLVEETKPYSFKLGRFWMDWPKASQLLFEPYLYNKDHIILTISSDQSGDLKYHLRPIKVPSE